MSGLQEFSGAGRPIRDVDLTVPNTFWQHSWLLVHRVALHERLKKDATSTMGHGTAAELHTANKVISVDPDSGTVALENGTAVTADVVVGADGIYVGSGKLLAWLPILTTAPRQ